MHLLDKCVLCCDNLTNDMVNRFEAVGIFISVALMAVALFILNFDQATERFAPATESTATVLLSEDNPYQDLFNSVDTEGRVNKLIIDDVVVGSGEAVAEGDTVSVHYIGTLQNGQQFDNSYLDGEPFAFTVGEGEVIDGWDEGVLGMKPGGQRILVIPSEMAYGDRQVGPVPANATLVFAVELLSIE